MNRVLWIRKEWHSINEIQSGQSEVLLHLFDNESFVGIDSSIFFHKKVHGAIDISDFKASTPRIRAAMEEISELIY